MKPLCLIPWTNIDVHPRGFISPCCKFEAQDSELLNIQDCTVEQYANSDFLSDIKVAMLDDRWPAGCIRCKTEEENNIQSKRQLDSERWSEHFRSYTPALGFITASVAFGNTCNLKCITCNPSSSSRWRKEYKDIYDVDKPSVETIDNVSADNIYNAMPNLIHFDIPGGEPLLSEPEKQKALLQRYIDSGQSHEMTLHYTTNAQLYPDATWFELWSHFDEIDMQLSIDGVGDRYEYIRYPAQSSKLDTHVAQYIQHEQQCENFRLSISHTVSAYNIYYLDEFFTWCTQHGLPRPWLGRVHTPKHMRPDVFPHTVKQQIIQHLRTSEYEDVHTWASLIENNDSSNFWDDFLLYNDKHDIYRNTNFARTFPELKELIYGVK